jgi:exosortase D (VPLPA-CTERM-specific)
VIAAAPAVDTRAGHGAWRTGLLFALAPVMLVALFAGGIANTGLRWWNEQEWNHGLIAICLVAYQIWRHRHDWRALPLSPNPVGTGLVCIAAAMAVLGELSATFFLSTYGLVIAVAGLVLAVWGWAGLRLAAMPLLLFAVVVPVPYFIEASLSLRLQLFSSQAGVAILQAIGITAHNDGNLIDLGPFQLDVAEACSGLRYLFPLTGLAVIVAALFQGRAWQRLLIVLSAPPIAVFMNVIRIAFVGVLVDREGIEAAEGFLHYFEGWVIFLICSLLLVAEVWLLNRLDRRRRPLALSFGFVPPRHGQRPPGLPPLRAPATLLVAVAVLAIAAAGTAALRFRPEPSLQHPAMALFPKRFPGWTGEPIALSSSEQDVLGHPEYALVTYTGAGDAIVNLFVAYYDRQTQGYAIHSPRACIPGGGWRITRLTVEEIPVGAGRHVRMNRVLIERDDRKQIVYYGFYQRGRWMVNEYGVKAALLIDAVTRNRTDGALVRLVAPVLPGMTERQADQRIAALLTESYPAIVQFVPR